MRADNLCRMWVQYPYPIPLPNNPSQYPQPTHHAPQALHQPPAPAHQPATPRPLPLPQPKNPTHCPTRYRHHISRPTTAPMHYPDALPLHMGGEIGGGLGHGVEVNQGRMYTESFRPGFHQSSHTIIQIKHHNQQRCSFVETLIFLIFLRVMHNLHLAKLHLPEAVIVSFGEGEGAKIFPLRRRHPYKCALVGE